MCDVPGVPCECEIGIGLRRTWPWPVQTLELKWSCRRGLCRSFFASFSSLSLVGEARKSSQVAAFSPFSQLALFHLNSPGVCHRLPPRLYIILTSQRPSSRQLLPMRQDVGA